MRVKYHEMISNLLENSMIEITEPEKEAPKIEEEDKEEDGKQHEEEKKEAKMLYDINFVYRTIERRLVEHP